MSEERKIKHVGGGTRCNFAGRTAILRRNPSKSHIEYKTTPKSDDSDSSAVHQEIDMSVFLHKDSKKNDSVLTLKWSKNRPAEDPQGIAHEFGPLGVDSDGHVVVMRPAKEGGAIRPDFDRPLLIQDTSKDPLTGLKIVPIIPRDPRLSCVTERILKNLADIQLDENGDLVGKEINILPVDFSKLNLTPDDICDMRIGDLTNGHPRGSMMVTSSDGSKGVIGRAVSDEDLPTDENGNKADIAVYGDAPICDCENKLVVSEKFLGHLPKALSDSIRCRLDPEFRRQREIERHSENCGVTWEELESVSDEDMERILLVMCDWMAGFPNAKSLINLINSQVKEINLKDHIDPDMVMREFAYLLTEYAKAKKAQKED